MLTHRPFTNTMLQSKLPYPSHNCFLLPNKNWGSSHNINIMCSFALNLYHFLQHFSIHFTCILDLSFKSDKLCLNCLLPLDVVMISLRRMEHKWKKNIRVIHSASGLISYDIVSFVPLSGSCTGSPAVLAFSVASISMRTTAPCKALILHMWKCKQQRKQVLQLREK